MKKIFLLSCICIMTMVFCSCEKTIELTDDENYLIAEYAAELLLKYDDNLQYKYYDDSEPATTRATTEEPQTTESVTTEEEASSGVVDATTEESQTTEDSHEAADFDIAELAGYEDFSITYLQYYVLDRYPSYDSDGVYIEISAPEGYKLLVLKFKIQNELNEELSIDMYSKGLEYSVTVNGDSRIKQMLTILIDDLYTYQGIVNAGGAEEVALLFQIPNSIANNISSIALRIQDGNDYKTIDIY